MGSSQDNPNVFSDDYADSIAESYADSVDAQSVRRSSADDPTTLFHDHDATASRIPSRYNIPTPNPPPNNNNNTTRSAASIATQLRHSIMKPLDATSTHSRTNSRRSTTRGSQGHPVNPPRASNIQRSVSSASSQSFANSSTLASPSMDTANGPSHPYSLYPQGLAPSRSASVATASTTNAASPSRLGNVPAHPYALYTQNVSDAEPALEASQPPIPVGFLGAGQTFHRRLGPEGEEQDIVGPDGHSEQLPPYSRFPDNVAQKTLQTPTVNERNTLSSPEQDSPLENPFRDPPSSTITQSTTVADSEDRSDRQDQEDTSEKSWKSKSWRERRHTRVCCMPMWLFTLLAVLVVVIAGVCGGLIGGFLGKSTSNEVHNHISPSGAPYSVITIMPPTSLIDAAEATETPSGLVPLPTGTWALDPQNVIVQAGCVAGLQQAAWACDNMPQMINVNISTDRRGSPWMSIIPANSSLHYGVQPPVIGSSCLQLVEDVSLPGKPLAYQFQTIYDKLVILALEDLAPPPSSYQARNNEAIPTGQLQPRHYPPQYSEGQGEPPVNYIPTTDSPWYCYWNSTFLEAFIYVDTDDDDDDDDSYTTSPAPTPSSLTVTTYTSLSFGPGFVMPTGSDPYHSNPTSPPAATPTPTYKPLRKRESDLSSFLYDATDVYTPSPSVPWSNTLIPSPMPRKIKIEERRLPDVTAPSPICVKMMWSEEAYTFIPWTDPWGANTILRINETDPSDVMSAVFSASSTSSASPTSSSNSYSKRHPRVYSDLANACYCQWNNG